MGRKGVRRVHADSHFPISSTNNSGFRNEGEKKLVILAQVKLKPLFLSVITQVGKLVFCCFNKWSGRRTYDVEGH